MQWILKFLNKQLTEERKWLRLGGLGSMDVKYKHSARMARERVPQLERAIALILGDHGLPAARGIAAGDGTSAQVPKPEPAPVVSPKVTTGQGKANPTKQLSLFDSIKTLNSIK